MTGATGGSNVNERFWEQDTRGEFPRRSRRDRRNSSGQRPNRGGTEPETQPHPAGAPATAQDAALPEEDARLWQLKVEQARAALADPPGPWPTRVSSVKAFAAVTLVVLTAVLAVVALPRLISSSADSDLYHSTTVQLPSEIDGLPRLAGNKVTAEDNRSAPQLLTAARFPLETMVGVYARPAGARLTVAAGRPAEPIPDADLGSIRDGFRDGITSAGGQVHEIDPGHLGGWFGCAQLDSGLTLCLALDATALVGISVTSNDPTAIPLAGAARNAVVHRA